MSLSQDGAFLSCPGPVDLGVLLPHLAGVIIEEVTAAAGLLLLAARARAATAACPACGTVSGQVHSRYPRTLADAAIGGRQAVILLTARRFFCTSTACKARTFAEQVDGLTSRYARKTPLLAGVLGSIAVALAGRAGSRLASGLAVPASRQVMLRLVMAIPDPAAASPRVAGVDDFAIRRGQHYGTLITDIETGAPLDLLEGRDAQPLADWLAAHPGVEVICRDRAGSYADGARTGVPDAVQVADRFHLWQNLAKAVEKCVAAHRACLAAPPPALAEEQATAPPEPEAAAQPDPTGKYAERTRRHHELVHGLRAEGRGLREIARHLGLGPAFGPAGRPRRDLAGTRRRTVEGSAPQQARPVQGLPRPARRRRPRQHPAPVPRDPGLRLRRQLPRRPRLPPRAPPRQAAAPARPAHRPRRHELAHPAPGRTGRRGETEAQGRPGDRCPELQATSDLVWGFAAMITELARQGPAAVDGRRPRGRAARHLVVRQGPGAGPRRRHQRPDHELELRPGRRPREPH